MANGFPSQEALFHARPLVPHKHSTVCSLGSQTPSLPASRTPCAGPLCSREPQGNHFSHNLSTDTFTSISFPLCCPGSDTIGLHLILRAPGFTFHWALWLRPALRAISVLPPRAVMSSPCETNRLHLLESVGTASLLSEFILIFQKLSETHAESKGHSLTPFQRPWCHPNTLPSMAPQSCSVTNDTRTSLVILHTHCIYL